METRYGLSAAALKYFAALCMLVDHMGLVFPALLSQLGLPAWADALPRLVGRLAFPIFAYFVAEGCRRTRFFSRSRLYDLVWGGSLVDENTVMVYISRLRAKIEDKPAQPRYIQTVRGLGYRFVAK